MIYQKGHVFTARCGRKHTEKTFTVLRVLKMSYVCDGGGGLIMSFHHLRSGYLHTKFAMVDQYLEVRKKPIDTDDLTS